MLDSAAPGAKPARPAQGLTHRLAGSARFRAFCARVPGLRWLAQREGIFCEPASAASIGGAMRDIKTGRIPEGSTIVCTLTGNGLKDPDTAIKQCGDSRMVTIDANIASVKDAILGNM